MCLFCENCGFKSNEIKSAGKIQLFGTRIMLQVKSAKDLDREVLKSDTAGIEIPEIELQLAEGGLGGVYTTVEGLLSKLHDRLKDANPFWTGDSVNKNHSVNQDTKSLRFLEVLENLANMRIGKRFPFTLIIDDPLSNSFISPIGHSTVNDNNAQKVRSNSSTSTCSYDTNVDIVTYERTDDQNETLGLNSLRTENDQDDNML